MKKIEILVLLFLLYTSFVNFFGNYELSLRTFYWIEPKQSDSNLTSSELGEVVSTSHSLTVYVKRARHYYIFPSYIGLPLPKVVFDGFNLYVSKPEWREIRIKNLNTAILLFFSLSIFLLLLTWFRRKHLNTNNSIK